MACLMTFWWVNKSFVGRDELFKFLVSFISTSLGLVPISLLVNTMRGLLVNSAMHSSVPTSQDAFPYSSPIHSMMLRPLGSKPPRFIENPTQARVSLQEDRVNVCLISIKLTVLRFASCGSAGYVDT